MHASMHTLYACMHAYIQTYTYTYTYTYIYIYYIAVVWI